MPELSLLTYMYKSYAFMTSAFNFNGCFIMFVYEGTMLAKLCAREKQSMHIGERSDQKLDL